VGDRRCPSLRQRSSAVFSEGRKTAYPTRLGEGLEACGNIDAVAEDIPLVDDDVTDIDPHAELDAPITRHPGVALRHLTLHLDRATYSIDNAGELDEKAVPGRLDNAAAVASTSDVELKRAERVLDALLRD
jgi:hypothetical protein